jgi:hypothetical protein
LLIKAKAEHVFRVVMTACHTLCVPTTPSMKNCADTYSIIRLGLCQDGYAFCNCKKAVNGLKKKRKPRRILRFFRVYRHPHAPAGKIPPENLLFVLKNGFLYDRITLYIFIPERKSIKQ